MNYINEALDIQNRILALIEEKDFEDIEALLEERKKFFVEYFEYNPKELKELLNSKEFKDSERKINLAFNMGKEKIKKELNTLKVSRNATRQYKNNVANRNMFFNKKI